jgi:hypothetical protein
LRVAPAKQAVERLDPAGSDVDADAARPRVGWGNVDNLQNVGLAAPVEHHDFAHS